MSFEKILNEIKNKNAKLVAVSKKQSLEKIRGLYDKGHRAFGENYVQELIEKKLHLNLPDIEWHLIGPLQANKVSKIVGEVELIHSVCDLKIAKKIDSVAAQKKIIQKILIQINLSNEKTKSGIQTQELQPFLEAVSLLKNIVPCGFMIMPPQTENAEDSRLFFRKIKEILVENQKKYTTLKELSMGSSQDYLVALQEGATIIRIGESVFGKRI